MVLQRLRQSVLFFGMQMTASKKVVFKIKLLEERTRTQRAPRPLTTTLCPRCVILALIQKPVKRVWPRCVILALIQKPLVLHEFPNKSFRRKSGRSGQYVSQSMI